MCNQVKSFTKRGRRDQSQRKETEVLNERINKMIEKERTKEGKKNRCKNNFMLH